MQHETNTTTGTTVSAEEAAILSRFAERAGKAADLDTNDDGNYMVYMAY